MAPTQGSATAARGVKLPYLRAWREYRLMSIKSLAKMAKASPATLIRAERHGKKVRYLTVGKLVAALSITPEQLVRQAPPTE